MAVGGKVYMITGVRSFVNSPKGRETKDELSERRTNMGGKIPLSEVVTYSGIPMGDWIDPSASHESETKQYFTSNTWSPAELCNEIRYQTVSVDSQYVRLEGDYKTFKNLGFWKRLFRKNPNMVLLDVSLPPHIVHNPKPSGAPVVDIFFIGASDSRDLV